MKIFLDAKKTEATLVPPVLHVQGMGCYLFYFFVAIVLICNCSLFAGEGLAYSASSNKTDL